MNLTYINIEEHKEEKNTIIVQDKNEENKGSSLANSAQMPEPKIDKENEKEEKKAVKEEKAIDQVNQIPELPKNLTLEVIEGTTIIPGTVFEIDCKGLQGSKRNAQDGYTYFGTDSGKDSIVNDVLVSKDEIGFGGKHFFIKYISETNSYVLKDLENGTGTFIKILPKLILKNNYIISFGEVHAIILFPSDALQKESNTISIKFIEGFRPKETLSFKTIDSPITIGRQDTSKIHIPYGKLSRQQCKIVYEKSNWVIYDGDGTSQSTNGTWIFAEDFYEIAHGTIFKAAQTLFKATIY